MRKGETGCLGKKRKTKKEQNEKVKRMEEDAGF